MERNINAGFTDYVKHCGEAFNIAAHKKRVKKIENIVLYPNGDFCSIAGTCIYKDQVGKEAINKIYSDYIGDIKSIRENAIGNYVICVKKNNHIIVFVDKYQILKVYYYQRAGQWFLTNSLADIGYILDNIEVDEFSLLQETMLVGAIGTQSIFKGVFRLFGHQYIDIDLSKADFSIKYLLYNRMRRSFQGRKITDAVAEYAAIIKSKFAPVADLWGDNIRIHQTGGLDNRTVFSAFMSVGCKPNIMYGVGNSYITNTKHDDLLLSKEYAKKFNVDLYLMNWKHDCLTKTSHWEHLFDRYGFYFSNYGGNQSFWTEYEGLIPDYPNFMECGYFLENLRLREWANNSGKNYFSIDEIVEGYLLSGAYGNFFANKKFYHKYDLVREHIKNIFAEFIEIYHINSENGISLDDFDQVRWIHSRNCDSITVNILNEFAPSIAMFSIPELHEFPFDVPADWRANGRFQIMLIDFLCPEVSDIPVFSHCTHHTLDKATYTLTPQYTAAQKIRKRFKKNRVT